MNKENNKLSKQGKILVLDRMLGNVVEIFLTTFLAAYFYKISKENIKLLSIYNIISYIVATVGAFAFGNYIKKRDKVKLYRIGTVVKALYVFLIILLKEKIVNYVYLIGFARGISISTTGFPFNMIESEQVNNNERTKYIGYKSAGNELIAIVVPIILGAYITFKSYHIAAIFVFICSLIKVVLMFCLENNNKQKSNMKLKKFAQIIKEEKYNKINKLYFIEFLKGITMYGVMQLVVSLLIIYNLNTELELGALTSMFSVLTVISMILFAKYYTKDKENITLNICIIAILLSFIIIMFSINMASIIIYNVVYYIFINILLNITEKRLFNYSNTELLKDEFNTEYFIFRELYLNMGRILGFIALLIVGITQNINILKLLLFFILIALLSIIYITKKLNKEEITIKDYQSK